MSKARRLSSFKTRLGPQRGQAYAEYLMVTAVFGVPLLGIVWGAFNDPTYISLASSLKSFFSAYSFTLSLP
ncbi:conserved hypothetical protein [Paraburkholderia phytofirmans PsJN]|uniref:Pilus assembly protein n=2 Tax=Paraburkholderia phytofirmans TaxID=261302 RepID=B2T9R3_PARPJ|nr:conserved hypothetical protein [Paraburkholderia phytofirmans PsJN]